MKILKDEILTNSEMETREFIRKNINLFVPGTVVALIGNLGAGKTLIVKEICAAFGITDVDSPTFTIVNEYSGQIKVNHIDFYRITKHDELIDIGIYDYINDLSALNLIEWADMFPEIIPKTSTEILVEIIGKGKRRIAIEINE